MPPAPPPRPSPARLILRLLIGALAALLACLLIAWWLLQPPPNHNSLAVGSAARVESLDIAIQPPRELDGLAKADVLELRREAALRHAQLLAGEYVPSEGVFGQIVDGLPWWGIEGQFQHGSGERSSDGASEEARFILNPYLLVAADFWGIAQPPYYCAPRYLRWQPPAAYGEVLYDAACVAQMNYGPFDLISYNARDLNLNFIYVDYAESLNISHPNPPASAYAIPHYLHQGGSCRQASGCNNMSPPSPEIDGLRVTALPARLVIRLWRNRPGSVDRAPDMRFVIRFE